MPNFCTQNDSAIYFFRVDASNLIGSGHVMRCITLARILYTNGLECIFLSHSLPAFIRLKIEEYNFHCIEINYSKNKSASPFDIDTKQDADCTLQCVEPYSSRKLHLVIDHYGIDYKWEKRVTPAFLTTLVIDDLANRSHFCDILLDQTYNRSSLDYKQHVMPHTKLLIGAEYALLRPEFFETRELAKQRRKTCDEPRKILINFGGNDIDNLCEWTLSVLNKHFGKFPIKIDIVVGAFKIESKELNKIAKQSALPIQIFGNVENMHTLMLEADIAIGAAGSSAWERCCLGLPSIMMTVAENQRKIATELTNQGSAYLVDRNDRERALFEAMNSLFDSHLYQIQSECAFEVCDGLGASKTANFMLRQARDKTG